MKGKNEVMRINWTSTMDRSSSMSCPVIVDTWITSIVNCTMRHHAFRRRERRGEEKKDKYLKKLHRFFSQSIDPLFREGGSEGETIAVCAHNKEFGVTKSCLT